MSQALTDHLASIAAKVWRSPSTGEPRWKGSLNVSGEKIGRSWPSVYHLQHRNPQDGRVREVAVTQQGRGLWHLELHGRMLWNFATKSDAQHAALQLLGIQ